MVELAKESTTMRRVLDPMFVYFDTGSHWVPRQGLALVVLSDMSYFVESMGKYTLSFHLLSGSLYLISFASKKIYWFSCVIYYLFDSWTFYLFN